MKTACPFCKVEYSLSKDCPRRVQCACCGTVWQIKNRERGGKGFVFAFALAILFLAVILFIVVLKLFPHNEAGGTMNVRLDNISYAENAIIISGWVQNDSPELSGVPDMVAIVKDAQGAELLTQKFSPPAPLLDAGEKVRFSNEIKNPPAGAVKVSIEFKE